MNITSTFAHAAGKTSKYTGKPSTFAMAVALIMVWAATGPMFGYSDTWQLVINSGTGVVTFLMVFLLQHEQVRAEMALHAKLDELIKATAKARDQMIGIEQRTEEEIAALRPRP